MPNPRRTKSVKSKGLNLPAKSMGFFVIPISTPSTCVHGEENLRPIQPTSLEQNENTSIESEIDTTPTSMNNLPEEDSNEKYYKNSEFLPKTRDGSRLALERKDESKGEMNKSNNGAVGDKTESAISLRDDITNLIIEHAKQIGRERLLNMEQKLTDLKQLLTESSTFSSKSTQTTNLNSEEAKLKTMNTKMENKNKIKHSVDAGFRKKRELVSLEMPNMEMETQARKTRKASEEAKTSTSLSLDPLFEYSCDCKRRGHTCNCGLKLATNIIQKMLGREPEIIKDDIAEYLRKPTIFTKAEDKKNQANELQEIKTLLQQYHMDIRHMLATIEPTKDESTEISDERSKFIKTKSISTENMIPKNRMKRKLPVDLINEKSRRNKNTEKIMSPRTKRESMLTQNNNQGLGKKSEVEHAALPERLKLEFYKRQLNHEQQVKDHLYQKHEKFADGVMEEIKRSVRSVRVQTRKIKTAPDGDIRQALQSASDSVENTSDDNRTNKFDKNNVINRNEIYSDEDKTKEADTFLNEISKEGNDLPNHLKHIQEDVYLVKPDINGKDNIQATTNKIEDKSEKKMKTSKSTSTTDITKSKMSLPEDSSSSEDIFVDATDSDIPSSMENSSEESDKDGLVDNVFHTMFDVLNDFHRKLLEYLHYLSR